MALHFDSLSSAERDERLLRDLLDLPVEERAGRADEFVSAVWRLLESFKPYVARLASSRVRPHAVEDVAIDVIMAAFSLLKCQYSHPDRKYSQGWYHQEHSFERWFLVYCGRPFVLQGSGVITNVIRREWRSYTRNVDLNDDVGEIIDETTANPEQDMLKSEAERAKSRDLQLLTEGIKKLERTRPRQAFALRLFYGVHDFEYLDSDAIIEIAQNSRLPRDQTKLVRTAVETLDLKPGQQRLNQKQIAHLTGVSERTVRDDLAKGEQLLQLAVYGGKRGDNRRSQEAAP